MSRCEKCKKKCHPSERFCGIHGGIDGDDNYKLGKGKLTKAGKKVVE